MSNSIVEDTTVIVKCRTTIKTLLLYFKLSLSVMLDSLSCLSTPISFLTNSVILRRSSNVIIYH